MYYYYVNKNAKSTGEHEIHTTECVYLPDTSEREYVGYYSDCKEALDKSLEKYEKVDGCKFCIPDCHTEED